MDSMDMSRNELACWCGVSRGYISWLKRGERGLSRLRRHIQEGLRIDNFYVLFVVKEQGE